MALPLSQYVHNIAVEMNMSFSSMLMKWYLTKWEESLLVNQDAERGVWLFLLKNQPVLCHESITDILVFEYGSDLRSYEQYLSSTQIKDFI